MLYICVCFVKQKTAYEMRISDWSSDVCSSDLVFASANVERQRQGLPRHYELMLLAASVGPVATSAGLKLVADASWAVCDPATLDTLLVPGGVGVDSQKHDQPLLDWLRAAEPRGRPLGSVVSGALILAETGLFDGRKAPPPRGATPARAP